MGTAAGGFLNVAPGMGRAWCCSLESMGSTLASCATDTVGVMGDTGGRSGESERERVLSRSVEGAVLSEGEVDRMSVGDAMVNAGILRGQRRLEGPAKGDLGDARYKR